MEIGRAGAENGSLWLPLSVDRGCCERNGPALDWKVWKIVGSDHIPVEYEERLKPRVQQMSSRFVYLLLSHRPVDECWKGA